MEVIIGMLAGLIVLTAFVAGVLVSDKLRAPQQAQKPPVSEEELYGMTAEEIKKHRAELKAAQEAFHATQTYSAETAYGIGKSELEHTLGM